MLHHSHTSRPFPCRLMLSFTVAISAICFGFLSVNPLSAQNTTPSFGVIGFAEESSELAARCQKNWETAHSYSTQVEAAVAANKFDQVKLKSFGTSFASAMQVFRDSQRLYDLSEPCGVDYEYRAEHIQKIMRDAARSIIHTPEGSDYSVKAEKYKNSSNAKRVKSLQRVRKLVQDGKIDQAEKELDEIQADVDSFTIWLNPNSTKQVVQQINPIGALVMPRAKQKRVTDANKALTAALKTNAPEIDAFLVSIENATAQIQKSGQATINGQSLSGPQALKAFFVQWQTAHTKLIRCMAISTLGNNELAASALTSIGTKLGSSKWSSAPDALSSKMTELLPKLIAADLKRAADDKTAYGVYIRYLSTLGFMANKSADDVIAACEKELAVLESRPGALATSIKNYKKATADMLLWRKRSARAAASVASSNDLSDSAAGLQGKMFSPNLLTGLDVVTPEVSEAAGKLNLHVSDVKPITPKAGFCGYDNSAWATVIGEFDVENEVLELRNDLFVSPDSPPLSPAAARSILTAKRKSLAAAGGPVSSVIVESFGVRFSKLPTNMGSLVPLNQMPVTNGNLGKTLLRVNLTPQWIQHEHFFKKL